jgi:Uma2 family endonuclease
MAQAHAPRHWTVADLEALPYDEWHRYEIIDGELFVSTAPRREHQLACNGSAFVLTGWNNRTGLGEVLPGAGVIFTKNDGVIPDVVWGSRAPGSYSGRCGLPQRRARAGGRGTVAGRLE